MTLALKAHSCSIPVCRLMRSLASPAEMRGAVARSSTSASTTSSTNRRVKSTRILRKSCPARAASSVARARSHS